HPPSKSLLVTLLPSSGSAIAAFSFWFFPGQVVRQRFRGRTRSARSSRLGHAVTWLGWGANERSDCSRWCRDQSCPAGPAKARRTATPKTCHSSHADHLHAARHGPCSAASV